MSRSACFALSASLLALAAGPVHAQEPVDKQAEALFVQGREALASKDFAVACERFRLSNQLVRRPSVLVNLAQCEEALGRLATAFSYWQQGLALLEPSDARFAVARERTEALDPRVPRLVLRTASSFPSSAVVKLDGTPLLATDLGSPICVDPGAHDLVVEVPGRRDRHKQVVAHEGARIEVLLQPGEDPVPAPPRTRAPEPAADFPRSGRAKPTAAWVAAGFGAAGLLTATITGSMLVSKKSTIDARCPDRRCDGQGMDAIDQANRLMTINSIGWGVGLLGAGLATWLFVSSPAGSQPPKTAVTPILTPGGMAWMVDRRF